MSLRLNSRMMTPNRIQLGEVFGIPIATGSNGSVGSSGSNENGEDIRSIDEPEPAPLNTSSGAHQGLREDLIQARINAMTMKNRFE